MTREQDADFPDSSSRYDGEGTSRRSGRSRRTHQSANSPEKEERQAATFSKEEAESNGSHLSQSLRRTSTHRGSSSSRAEGGGSRHRSQRVSSAARSRAQADEVDASENFEDDRRADTAGSRSGFVEASTEEYEAGGEVLSLSISETNKLRESLGLRPLDVGTSSSKKDAVSTRKNVSATKGEGKNASGIPSRQEEGVSSVSATDFGGNHRENRFEDEILRPTALSSVGLRSSPSVAVSGRATIHHPQESAGKSIAKRFFDEQEEDLDPLSWVKKQRKNDTERLLLAQQACRAGNAGISASSQTARGGDVFQESSKNEVIPGVVYSDDEDSDEENESGFGGSNRQAGKQIPTKRIGSTHTVGSATHTANQKKAENSYLSDSSGKFHIVHDIKDFNEGEDVILTLKDRSILDDEGQLVDEIDELESINITEAHIRQKRQKDKARSIVYNPISDLLEDEAAADNFSGLNSSTGGRTRDILEHYDEWAEGAKPKPLRRGFDIVLDPEKGVLEGVNVDKIRKTAHTLNGDEEDEVLQLGKKMESEEERRVGFFGASSGREAANLASHPDIKKANKNVKKGLRKKPKLTGKDFWDDVFKEGEDVSAADETGGHRKEDEAEDSAKKGGGRHSRRRHTSQESRSKQEDTDAVAPSSSTLTYEAVSTAGLPISGYSEFDDTHIVAPTRITPEDNPAVFAGEQDDNELLYEQLSRQKRMLNSNALRATAADKVFDIIGKMKEEGDFSSSSKDVEVKHHGIVKEEPEEKLSGFFDLKSVYSSQATSEVKTEQDEDASGILLTSTTEFCRTVQTPLEKLQAFNSETYTGSALYRQQQLMRQKLLLEDKERVVGGNDEVDSDMEMSEDEDAGRKEDDDENDETEKDAEEITKILSERSMDSGIFSALEYLKSKGDLSDDKWRSDRANPDNLPIHMSTDEGDIKLDYKDEYGRAMTPKEAFRQISWIFHGKGPGKAKLQSKLRKMELERKLRDKPLETLPTMKALRRQQKSTGSAHLLLSRHSLQK